MLRILLCLSLVMLGAAACTGSQSAEDPAIRPTQTLRYDAERAARPTAPAPIDGGFREDDAVRVVLNSATGRHVLFLFIYTDYCGNCLAMRPYIAQLEAEYWDKVDFLYLNRENYAESYEILTHYEVISQPEFLLLDRNNQVVEHWRGAPPIADLRRAIDDLLASEQP